MESQTIRASKIQILPWGIAHGRDVYLFRLVNSRGNYVELSNYGASIISINVADRFGNTGDVALGYDNLDGYINDQFYVGATIGRFANRISNAGFKLDGVQYDLEANDGANNNHGGASGYNKRVFEFVVSNDSVRLTLTDLDSTGGYPGTVDLQVSYRWTDENELIINYEAETDKPTIVNFTNHTYFNLSSKGNDIAGHYLALGADLYLENDTQSLPTGRIVKDEDGYVNGKNLDEVIDFNKPIETGLNRYFILLNNENNSDKPHAKLYDDESGIELSVYTTYPGIMVYTAQYLDTIGKNGKAYKALSGICLECQHYPDSIKNLHFPQAILRPGELYNEFIKFQFNIK